MKHLQSFRVPATVEEFRWKTMDGQILTLPEMKTGHIFNSMKMIFNHIAEAHGGKPVWFQYKYRDYRAEAESNPTALAWIVLLFMREIESRGDLPEKYAEPYAEIKRQIVGMQQIAEPQILISGGADA